MLQQLSRPAIAALLMLAGLSRYLLGLAVIIIGVVS